MRMFCREACHSKKFAPKITDSFISDGTRAFFKEHFCDLIIKLFLDLRRVSINYKERLDISRIINENVLQNSRSFCEHFS